MTPTVCVCCGERISESGNALSRNPNICACCSSLADGMEESDVLETAELALRRTLADAAKLDAASATLTAEVAETAPQQPA
jgi:hypothetical protein